jgi:hypothetical protein
MYATYEEKYHPAYKLLMGLSAEQVSRVTSITAPKYGKDTLPTTVVTDASGRILLSTAGIPSVSQICRLLREQGISSAACRPTS